MELMQAWRAGDRLALERLLTPYEMQLYHLCLGILRNREDAEDAVQEAFLRALRGMDRFRGDAAVRTWLQRIAVNVCVEWKRSRRQTAALDSAGELAAPEASVEDRVLGRVEALDALGALSVHQRAAIVLKDVQGLSTDEVAAAMGWSIKKVENELYRGRKALAAWRMRGHGNPI
jgi:RNA polymerase sigma-70 factor (ECF subfamily)